MNRKLDSYADLLGGRIRMQSTVPLFTLSTITNLIKYMSQ